MREITPIRDKILGRMLETFGANRTTPGGLVLTETDMNAENAIRPRWFEVTHVGPEQEEILAGQYVLVEHGRWSRGINLEGTMREEDKLFLIDNDEMLMVSDNDPLS